MAIKILKEGVNRTQGQPVHATAGVADVVIAGMPLFEATDTTGQVGNYPQLVADGKLSTALTSAPIGLALESNQMFQPNLNNPGAGYGGQSGDYTNYNRGGLVAAMGAGAVLQLFDDGRLPYSGTPNAAPGSSSHPCDTSRTYVKNEPLYTNITNGKLTNDAAQGTKQVAVVKDVTGSGQTLVVTAEVRF